MSTGESYGRYKRALVLFLRRWRHRIAFRTTPHQMALGVAIGVFGAFQPIPLLGLPLALALAWVLGANRFVVVPLLLITNPLTVVPIYVLSYWLGCWLLGRSILPVPWEILYGGLSMWQRAVLFYETGSTLFLPILVGATVLGLLLAVASYGLVRFVLGWLT